MAAASPLLLLADGIIVRAVDDGRLWQTCLEPSAPLRWPWELGAETATLTVSNLASGAVSVSTVARDGDAAYGEFAVSAAPLPEERLFAVTLEQSAGDAVVRRDEARIAYIPGVSGGGITVRAARPSVWRQSEKSAVFAYDAKWADGDEMSVSWTARDGSSGSRPLLGTSGYDVVSLADGIWTKLSLMFDGETVASASLVPWHGGFSVIVR